MTGHSANKGRAGDAPTSTRPCQPLTPGAIDVSDVPKAESRLKPLTPRQAAKLYRETFERPSYVRVIDRRPRHG